MIDDSAKNKLNEAINLDKEAMKKSYEAICEPSSSACNYFTKCIQQKPMPSMLLAALFGSTVT